MPRLITRSPCIGVCAYDERGLCRGCGRAPEEITAWRDLDDQRRHEINLRLLKTQGEPVRRKLLGTAGEPSATEAASPPKTP
jgi:predicted Fe-S protein YdhL (DUF1289 family)